MTIGRISTAIARYGGFSVAFLFTLAAICHGQTESIGMTDGTSSQPAPQGYPPGAMMHERGTCFVVANDGNQSIALTNRHAVESLTSLSVTFPARQTVPARVIYTSSKCDMAVISFQQVVPPIRLAADISRPGDAITAWGFPHLAKTVYISHGETKGYWNGEILMGTALVDYGVSGGPILNSASEVVGQVFAKDAPDGPGNVQGNNLNQIRSALIAAGYT